MDSGCVKTARQDGPVPLDALLIPLLPAQPKRGAASQRPKSTGHPIWGLAPPSPPPEPGASRSLPTPPEGPQPQPASHNDLQAQGHRLHPGEAQTQEREGLSGPHSCPAPHSWVTGTPTFPSRLGELGPSFCFASSVIPTMSPLGWGT